MKCLHKILHVLIYSLNSFSKLFLHFYKQNAIVFLYLIWHDTPCMFCIWGGKRMANRTKTEVWLIYFQTGVQKCKDFLRYRQSFHLWLRKIIRVGVPLNKDNMRGSQTKRENFMIWIHFLMFYAEKYSFLTFILSWCWP